MSPASRGRQQTGKFHALCSVLSCGVRNGACPLAVRGESCAFPGDGAYADECTCIAVGISSSPPFCKC